MAHIKFLVNEVFSGWSPKDTRLGGTEESVVEWAKRIAEKGHKVTVYQNGYVGTDGEVNYLPRELYVGDNGITINVKSYDIPPKETTWYLTNEWNAETNTGIKRDYSAYTGIIWPSKWALDHCMVKHDTMRVVPHGFDLSEIYPEEKIPNMCLYSSSPDRGLDEFQYIWPDVVKEVPDAQLVVTYGGNLDLPNVINLGDVDMDTMNSLYRTSQFWLHPCTGIELYCMAAVKAMAAQCIPVYYPAMALRETIASRWRGVQANRNNFAKRLVSYMKSERRRQELLSRVQKEVYPDWDISTDILLKTIGVNPLLKSSQTP